MGRVIIAIPVGREADPDRVTSILLQCAADNSDLLDDPPPIVLFKKIGDFTKDFELIAYVADVDFAAQVSSDLTFAIDRALRAENIGDIPHRTILLERSSH
jgi:small-conductance mechanosensitive channel